MKYLFSILLMCCSSLVCASQFSIEEFIVVATERINLKEYQIEYRLKIKNNGVDASGLTTTISSTDESITVLQNSLEFGDVPANATVESTNTFSIRKDRTVEFESQSLVFTFKEIEL